MTKVMLIAGVAALAISAPVAAGPHGGGHGDRQQQQQRQVRGGGGYDAPRAQVRERVNFEQRGRARADFAMQRQAMQRQRGEQRQARAFQMERQAMQRQRGEQRQARAFQMERNQQRQARVMQAHAVQAQRREQHQAQMMMRRDQQRQAHEMQAHRNEMQAHRMEQRQAQVMRRDEQRQARALQQQRQAQAFQQRNQQRQFRAMQRDERQARMVQQQQFRAERQQARNQALERRDFDRERFAQAQMREQIRNQRQDYARMAARQFAQNAFARSYANARTPVFFDGCPSGLITRSGRCLPPRQAISLLGAPVSRVASFAPLAVVPQPLQYLYPDTPDYYYRYGDGYMYQVNRSSNLINSLLPLIGGGYLPGMTFPTSYMNSYVPNYYGYDSFYADTPYVDYRYMDGNVYGVDPYSGTIQDVIPTYGYGYGVGQALPAGYGYYNVPNQYRSVYYNTPDNNYWYAPGAIYQVDPNTQLITSVASLLAPGLAVGQALPMGYGTYNVPMAYRSTYYDTPNAWYRYSNGNIYQVDPTTQIVRAIVASLLT